MDANWGKKSALPPKSQTYTLNFERPLVVLQNAASSQNIIISIGQKNETAVGP